MQRFSDYDDHDEPDETNELTLGAAIVGVFFALVVVPVSDLFQRRRNPRRARWFSRWAIATIEVVGIVVVMVSLMILSGAQP